MWLLQVVELLLHIFENILDNFVDSSVRISPDVVEQYKCVNVNVSFNREFSKQEVEQRHRAGVSQVIELSLFLSRTILNKPILLWCSAWNFTLGLN